MGIFEDFFMPHNADNDMDGIKQLVDDAISLYEQGDIPALQNTLYETYLHFNKPGGGRSITEFPEKDRMCEMFTFCLEFDWEHNDEIREVWSEDGFYCITTYLCNDAKTEQDFIAGYLDMFLLLYHGRHDLQPKVQDVLNKAEIKGESVFSKDDYAEGADYVIRQFMFLAATAISPADSQFHIISQSIQPAFRNAKSDYEFVSIPPKKILAKACFIAKIIEYILKNM